jgi:penicillin-binding protein 1A
VRERLRNYDRGRGEWRSEYKNILVDELEQPLIDEKAIKQKLNSFKHADWYGDEYKEGDYLKGLVISIDSGNDTAQVRFGKYKAIVSSKEMGRSTNKSPKDELKVGNICEFSVDGVDDENQTLKVTLQQIPEVQASIVCINAKNGEIVAMIGGYDFHTSKFNNATQALRQTGSAFKPFIYTAAVEWGITPDMTVSGAPIRRGGWMPHNYDGSYSHPNVPMKTALAKSYNLAAVHLLDQVGIQTGSQMVRRFGITNPMAPVLPSALGASEVSLLEMVSAYSAFPNKGIRVEPHLVRKVLDRDGKVLEEWEKTTYTVTTEYVASTMVKMMRGVVQGGGTATNASAGGHPLAGKTGTVNNQTDVWFVGFTPTYVTGIWMGNPLRKESLGRGMTGGHGAVPYFNGFMIPFMKDKPSDSFSEPPPMPAEIKRLNEIRKREEVEKLEKADEAGRRLGVSFNPGRRNYATGGNSTGINRKSGNNGERIGNNDTPTKITGSGNIDVLPSTRTTDSTDSGIRPNNSSKPPDNSSKKPDAPPPAVQTPQKKGKKGEPDKDN